MTTTERNKYRIVFMGTPDFAVASLVALHEAGYHIVGVLTTPPKKAGRGLKALKCAVHIKADELNIPVCAPENTSDPKAIETICDWQADLGVVVAFKKLPEGIYNAPRLGTFNLHASYLPDYRGAAPINRAIMNGESETGVSTFLLNDRIDEGHIFYQEKLDIHFNETAGELHDRMMSIGAKLVVKTADDYTRGKVAPKPQSNRSDKKAPKIFREHTRIEWDKPIINIHNQIRGLSPYPGAYTMLTSPKGMELKIYRTAILEAGISEGLTEGINTPEHIREKDAWFVKNSTGMMEVLEVQPKGKRKMLVKEWLNGLPEGAISTE
ncbi:MAG: methionyl-tRNA formyltransferase [Cryomorphaceae bacterium]|nr:methionyl-tRNA formyltransferase [Cryomorphaceae bacterium]